MIVCDSLVVGGEKVNRIDPELEACQVPARTTGQDVSRGYERA